MISPEAKTQLKFTSTDNETVASPDHPKPLIQRQALHAFRLQFVHPIKFHRMGLEAPIPPDMLHILELLRANRT